MEEVLEFVTQFEGEIKMLRDFLTAQTSQVEAAKRKEESFSEETWSHLQLVRGSLFPSQITLSISLFNRDLVD